MNCSATREAVRERKFAELVVGKYEVLERLGAGGMGTVFKARHRRMKRVVALKVLSRHISQGQIDHVKQALSRHVRQMWDEAEASIAAKPVAEEQFAPVI